MGGRAGRDQEGMLGPIDGLDLGLLVLNVSSLRGGSPMARQMRETNDCEIPIALAIDRVDTRPMVTPVYIRKQKRPYGSGLWGAYPTAEDQFGHWLFTPRGSIYRGESHGTTGYCNVGSPTGPGIPVIHVVPPGAWWIATFWAPGEASWIVTFDISTPPHLLDRVWCYDDLELDLLLDGLSGEVRTEDQDEFEDAIRLGLINEDEAAAARAAAEAAVELISDRHGVFVRTGQRLLSNALDLGLEPITQLPATRPG